MCLFPNHKQSMASCLWSSDFKEILCFPKSLGLTVIVFLFLHLRSALNNQSLRYSEESASAFSRVTSTSDIIESDPSVQHDESTITHIDNDILESSLSSSTSKSLIDSGCQSTNKALFEFIHAQINLKDFVTRLPFDVVEIIFSHLDPADLVCCGS
jgi:hypothetical protein